jgi:hypothetical protein
MLKLSAQSEQLLPLGLKGLKEEETYFSTSYMWFGWFGPQLKFSDCSKKKGVWWILLK